MRYVNLKHRGTEITEQTMNENLCVLRASVLN